MSSAIRDITFTPDTVRRLQQERITQLEQRIDKLTKELYEVGQEHAMHQRMLDAYEEMFRPASPVKLDPDF